MARTYYYALAQLLDYPTADYKQRITQVKVLLLVNQEQAAQVLERYRKSIEAISMEGLEELFTGTFDMMSVCIPYVSIHLFGEENFKRGEFMARLNNRYEETGFKHGDELPDHLSVMLRYLAQAEDGEAAELVKFCILAPLEKMISKLHVKNPYSHLLDVIETTLKTDFPKIVAAPLPVEQKSSFGSCQTVSNECGCSLVPPTNEFLDMKHLTATRS